MTAADLQAANFVASARKQLLFGGMADLDVAVNRPIARFQGAAAACSIGRPSAVMVAVSSSG